MPRSLLVTLAALGAGLLVAAALPPVGVWPLAVAGIAILDRLLAGQGAATRFRRGSLVGAGWLFPTLAWMVDMTLPGYVVAATAYSALVGLAALAVPPGRGRRLALPAALTLVEALRWAWPFGGVPLSTLAMGQAAGPLAAVVRVGGSLLLVAAVATAGVALSAALERRWRPALAGLTVVAALLAAAAVAPDGRGAGRLDVALVQGGGPQGTRASSTDERQVFERHLAASRDVPPGTDLVVWPENVVNVEGPVTETREGPELALLARSLGTTLVAGVVEGDGDAFHNAAVVWAPDGTIVDRYEKVQRVPFGEYVPFRSLLDDLVDLSEVPRDAVVGAGPAVVDSPQGPLAVAISWEIFFPRRGVDGVANGGELLLNPTNGSSYRGILVQSQQIASSRLRAIETGRWVLQVAPTGFSALVTPDGRVVARSAVGEQTVVTGTVERRTGRTLYVRWGDAPVLVLAALALGLAWALAHHHPGARRPAPAAVPATPEPSPAD
ncbi:MAG: apolipoprotein N-acyltransferase [Acidimicrobiales bacterium]|nr:apolipoprotein N-acyltransferase [Acidimicrobiales bacterium]